jgi:outer membrane protein insertion porin family
LFEAVQASALPVTKIVITGNKTVNEGRILLLLKTKVGAQFDEELWKKDIANLIETGYFASVDYTTSEVSGGMEINLSLKENPLITGIEFYCEGLKQKELEKQFGIAKGSYYQEPVVRNAVEKLRSFYEEKGYSFSSFSFNAIPGPDNTVTLRVTGVRGKKYRVMQILITGNDNVPEKRLRALLKTKQRRIPIFLGTYKEETADSDAQAIAAYYHNNGFPDCTVEKSVEQKDRGLILTFTVHEGARAFFGKTEFSGNITVSRETLEKQVTFHEGEPFSQSKFDATMQNLQNIYFDLGYLNATLIPIPSQEKDRINFMFQINPGEKVTVEEIRITGNTKTKDKVIRREIKLAPGDVFSGAKARKSFNNLMDLNYFDEVRITPQMRDEKTADIVVDVKERERTGILAFGGGYSSLEKAIGFVSIEQRNFDITNFPSFSGGGQYFKLYGQAGTIAKGFRLTFTEPYFMDRPVWIGPDFYALTNAWDGFTEKHSGGDLRIGRRWENFSLGFTLKIEEATLRDIQIPSFVSQAGSKQVHSIKSAISFNKLDRMTMPTSGDKVDLSVEYAGGIFAGDVDFVRTTLENHYYFPIKNWVVHSKTVVGSVNGFGDTKDIPLYERFFGGGIGTVRGYEERSLGRQENGYFLGGKYLFAQNIELLYPFREGTLWGAVFYDIGNVWEDSFDFSQLKQGAGIGLRIRVPLFGAPIQLDYGWPLNPGPGEGGGRLHFGMSFGF